MKEFKTLQGILSAQRSFGELLDQFGRDDEKKLELTKTLLLSLHNEVGQLTNSINFRHHTEDRFINRNKMLFESVDVVRYITAVLNTWDFSSEDLEAAMQLRDSQLNIRHRLLSRKWSGEPVVIVDVDDVVADFRTKFYEWLESKGVKTNLHGKEYYNTDAILQAGIDPTNVFEDFISAGGMMELEPLVWLRDELNAMRKRGFWIQILTARPQENPMCECATYAWLERHGFEVDGIGFSPEKYRWLTQQDYFLKGKVMFAMDDSPKHALEYASHGIRVLSPQKTYNEQLVNVKNIDIYDTHQDFLNSVNNLEVK
jgi:hypothetical protein